MCMHLRRFRELLHAICALGSRERIRTGWLQPNIRLDHGLLPLEMKGYASVAGGWIPEAPCAELQPCSLVEHTLRLLNIFAQTLATLD